MVKLKKILTLGITVLAVGVTSFTTFAASDYNTPAEAVAGLTGKSLESVIAERTETGKTYGNIANEKGKLTEFKKEMFEIKKEVLGKKVADGKITQEKANEIITAIEKNQINCNGDSQSKIGQKIGVGFRGMNRYGNGNDNGQHGQGYRLGQGLCDGAGQITK
jgi:hypothetical protein